MARSLEQFWERLLFLQFLVWLQLIARMQFRLTRHQRSRVGTKTLPVADTALQTSWMLDTSMAVGNVHEWYRPFVKRSFIDQRLIKNFFLRFRLPQKSPVLDLQKEKGKKPKRGNGLFGVENLWRLYVGYIYRNEIDVAAVCNATMMTGRGIWEMHQTFFRNLWTVKSWLCIQVPTDSSLW